MTTTGAVAVTLATGQQVCAHCGASNHEFWQPRAHTEQGVNAGAITIAALIQSICTRFNDHPTNPILLLFVKKKNLLSFEHSVRGKVSLWKSSKFFMLCREADTGGASVRQQSMGLSRPLPLLTCVIFSLIIAPTCSLHVDSRLSHRAVVRALRGAHAEPLLPSELTTTTLRLKGGGQFLPQCLIVLHICTSAIGPHTCCCCVVEVCAQHPSKFRSESIAYHGKSDDRIVGRGETRKACARSQACDCNGYSVWLNSRAQRV